MWGGGGLRHPVLWMAPFLSGGAYGDEATACAAALEAAGALAPRPDLRIRHHGGVEDPQVWNALPAGTKQLLFTLLARDVADVPESIVVCHSEPGVWYPSPYPTLQCPPRGYGEPLFVVGRTMSGIDVARPEHVARCNSMDEVWVPTQFHLEALAARGVDREKLVKVAQSVDTNLFTRHALVASYLRKFSASDAVDLHMLVAAPEEDDVDAPSKHDYAAAIRGVAARHGIPEPPEGYPVMRVVGGRPRIARADPPGVYKCADCFVLPSPRRSGGGGGAWVKPAVEAMATGLPVIATNRSAMTEYLSDENSYPISLDDMPAAAAAAARLWADESGDVQRLRSQMRHVFSHQSEARRTGKAARRDIVRKHAPEAVDRRMVVQLMRIQEKLDAKKAMQ